MQLIQTIFVSHYNQLPTILFRILPNLQLENWLIDCVSSEKLISIFFSHWMIVPTKYCNTWHSFTLHLQLLTSNQYSTYHLQLKEISVVCEVWGHQLCGSSESTSGKYLWRHILLNATCYHCFTSSPKYCQ